MKVYKAPEPVPYDDDIGITLFLGGSIEMGAAENWQERLTRELSDIDDLTILNPRRDDWDSSWVQDPTPGTKFREQVDWELDNQVLCDINLYYFVPGTMSPITLLELGAFCDTSLFNTIVFCPKEFWRYGNVAVLCERAEVPLFDSFDALVVYLREEINAARQAKKDFAALKNMLTF